MVRELHVFPVPSTGLVFLDAPEGGDLSIFAADGRLVHRSRAAASATPVRLELGGRPGGVYHGILQHNGLVERFRIILE